MRRFLIFFALLALAAVAPAQSSLSPEQAIDRFIQQERVFSNFIRGYTPMVETYLQKMEAHKTLGQVPSEDRYFLGRLRIEEKIGEHFFMTGDKALAGKFRFGRSYSAELSPVGFSSMVFVDREAFDREHYDFKFLHREFVGEVRCLVYDVLPRKNSGKNRFHGRIWVEDEEFNIIRFNGTYGTFHFDSWRMNLRSGMWLPAYIYSQETDLKYGMGKHMKFMAQTRLWGYNLSVSEHQEELTQIVIDPRSQVKDEASAEEDLSPLEARRLWQRRAEDNILNKLEQVGVLSPAGEVDNVLQTVVNNLEITNDLVVEPEIRCRVLLTTPLETTTIGHTILVSRGLLDVLPDEASLAAVLAHSLGHIVRKHELDAKYGFHDKTQFADETSFRELDLRFTPEQEDEANAEAVKLLRNSPYKDKLDSGGLFLKALSDYAPRIPNLVKANLGNSLVSQGKLMCLPELAQAAPELAYQNITQIPALPLGSRIKLDPWANQVRLIKAKPARVLEPEDKLLFGMAPFAPYISRPKPNVQASQESVR